ncbi:MAG: CPBP family intramembrane glutamic endopeptidase, partial [Nitrospirota bacterium]
IFMGTRVKLRLSLKDLLVGIGVSALILVPYGIAFGSQMRNISLSLVFYQLIIVAFPEEFFFRGFLQDSLRGKYKAVLLASLLFAFAHLPKVVFDGEWISLLSFFPSFVMGWLYLKTNSILPGTIFHWIANLVHYSAGSL